MKNLLLVLLLPVVALAQEKAGNADPTKRKLELPVENVLATAKGREGKPPADLGKGAIEMPTKRVVRSAEALNRLLGQLPSQQPNPPAKPGDVRWLPSFKHACVASQKSGKPVLLFHLMGKLDERFT